MATDTFGSIVLTGYLNGRVDLDEPDHTLSSVTVDEVTETETRIPSAFTVKLIGDGQPGWYRVHRPNEMDAGLPGWASGVSVAIDHEENVVVLGSYSGGISFDGYHLEDGGGYLAKLDGTAKGGIVVVIREELGIPVKFVGLGERPEDFAAFEPDLFVDAMFASED